MSPRSRRLDSELRIAMAIIAGYDMVGLRSFSSFVGLVWEPGRACVTDADG